MRFLLVFSFALPLFMGCDAPIERFEPNQVYALTLAKSRSTPTDAATDDTTKVIDDLFGSPDQPRWPESLAESMPNSLVDRDRLQRAAGSVSSEKDGTHRGLFREHCVVCHGLQGSGAGPASLFQNPYPRDFRHGVFKWKSTQRSSKPTRDDVRSLLTRGVPSTAMPSFLLLRSEDVDALVDYVIYLSVRGEVERRLMAAAVDELDYAENPPQDDWRLAPLSETAGGEVVREVLAKVSTSWNEANQETVSVPTWTALRGEPQRASVQRGKNIFHGQIANCVGCHGPSGNGNLITLDYDDWTKEFSSRIGLTPSDRDAMRLFKRAGALTPRQIRPRNLQDGVFCGGGDPETLYRRFSQGIPGTPMPAVEVVQQEGGKGLTEDQVWDLVRYVMSLSQLASTD